MCVLAFNVKGKWEKRNCYSEWKMGVEGGRVDVGVMHLDVGMKGATDE